ncbi:MAG: FGGY family carbohydrate kinase [Acidimicrobiales bacterium]
MTLVLGIDSSTQSNKAELRRIDTGELIATGRGRHPATSPPRSEQDPRAWWSALTEALAPLADHLAEVSAISVAGQQHGLVLLDSAGEPLRPAKLWNDTESAPQATAMVSSAGAANWARACGSVPVASITITKLAWVAEHEPELLDRIAHAMLPHDYLTYRLTGRVVTDRGDASGTGWWSPITGTYRPDLLEAAGLDAGLIERFPSVLQPLEIAGEVGDNDLGLLRRPSSPRAPATTWPGPSASASPSATSPCRSAPRVRPTRSARCRRPTRPAPSPGSPTPPAATSHSSPP